MFAPWKESYDKLGQHIQKQTHHLAGKGPYSQSYGFPVVMYACKSWTIKKVEHQRIDAFKLWCWRRLLRVSWTASRSTLKEVNSEYSLEGLMLNFKIQNFGHLITRDDSLEKTMMLGKIKSGKKKGAIED